MSLEKCYKISLSHLSGLSYNAGDCKCEECSFIPQDNCLLLEILCDHLVFKYDCKNALKYMKTFIFGFVKCDNTEATNNYIELVENDKYLKYKWRDKELKINNFSLLNTTEVHEADELDWIFLEKYCQSINLTETDEHWRLLSFKSWNVSNIVTPLALAHSGFKQVDPFTAKCVFCDLNTKWKQGDEVQKVHSNLSPNCKMLSHSTSNNKLIPSRILCRFRMKQFLKEYACLYGDSHPSDLPQMLKTLWTLFKRDEAHILKTDASIFEHFKALLSQELQEKFTTKLDCSPVADDRQSLLKEETQLREAKLCRLCMEEIIDTVFLPCGHFMSCLVCSRKLKTCAVCREVIIGTVIGILPELSL